MRIIYPMDCNGSASAITCKYVISHIIKNPYKISRKSIKCVNVQYLFYCYYFVFKQQRWLPYAND